MQLLLALCAGTYSFQGWIHSFSKDILNLSEADMQFLYTRLKYAVGRGKHSVFWHTEVTAHWWACGNVTAAL